MEITEDQLQEMIDRKVSETLEQRAHMSGRSLEWVKLNQEIEDYLKRFNQEHDVKGYQLKNAINTAIRFHLNIRSVYNVDETNIDEARKVFEMFKQTI